jgi:Type II intron maturase
MLPYLRRGKPDRRTALQNLDDYDIVKTFGAEYRGIVGYYVLATDVWRFNRLRWVAKTSMLKTPSRHRSLESLVHRKMSAGFGGRSRGKGPAHQRIPRRATHPVD